MTGYTQEREIKNLIMLMYDIQRCVQIIHN